MIEVDNSEMQKFQKMMSQKAPKQFGYAVRNTLNNLAAASNHIAKTKGTSELTKRSKYINKTIQFEKAKGTNVDSMASMFGQVSRMYGKKAGQLAIQETGGVLKPKGGKSLRKGTKSGRTSKSYRKGVTRRAAKTKFLTPKKFFKGSGSKPRTKRGMAIGLIAWAKRNRFPGYALMESPSSGKYGAFRVTGSKNKNAKLNMVFNLETRKQRIKAIHWMEKSYKEPVKRRQQLFEANLKKQLILMEKML